MAAWTDEGQNLALDLPHHARLLAGPFGGHGLDMIHELSADLFNRSNFDGDRPI